MSVGSCICCHSLVPCTSLLSMRQAQSGMRCVSNNFRGLDILYIGVNCFVVPAAGEKEHLYAKIRPEIEWGAKHWCRLHDEFVVDEVKAVRLCVEWIADHVLLCAESACVTLCKGDIDAKETHSCDC